MKKLIVLAVLVFGGFQVLGDFGRSVEPIHDEPYVAVYGRDSCGFTQKMISDLKASGVDYQYFVVDDQRVADTLHARMDSSGISTRRYNLPVVDVNGGLSVRPELQKVLREYNAQL